MSLASLYSQAYLPPNPRQRQGFPFVFGSVCTSSVIALSVSSKRQRTMSYVSRHRAGSGWASTNLGRSFVGVDFRDDLEGLPSRASIDLTSSKSGSIDRRLFLGVVVLVAFPTASGSEDPLRRGLSCLVSSVGCGDVARFVPECSNSLQSVTKVTLASRWDLRVLKAMGATSLITARRRVLSKKSMARWRSSSILKSSSRMRKVHLS